MPRSLIAFFLFGIVTSIFQAGTSISAPNDDSTSVRSQRAQKPNQNTSKPKQKIGAFLQSPFDPAVAKLPGNFQGHDPGQVFKAIRERKGAMVKGEFESSEVYSRRVEALKIAPLFGKVSADSMLAFILEVDPVYDADAATFLLVHQPRQIGFIETYTSSLAVAATLNRTATFKFNQVRQNAYGAKVDVLTTTGLEILGMMRTKEGVFDRAGAKLTISIPREQAPSVKPNLALLLICKLDSLEPLRGFYFPGGDATFNRPVETSIIQSILQIEPLQLWAINKQTGDVYAKRDPK